MALLSSTASTERITPVLMPHGSQHRAHPLHRRNLLWSALSCSIAQTTYATSPSGDAASNIPNHAHAHSSTVPPDFSDDSDASTQCGDHVNEHDADISLNSHTSSLQPDDQSIGSMLDSATSDEVDIVSVGPTSDDDQSTSETSTMPLLANDDDGERQRQDTDATNDPHVGTIHDADSGSGSGGGTHLASVPQLSTPDYNDTHFPHSDPAYRRSDANTAAVALALPHGRLCSANNCKRFSRFSFTNFEWPACCTLCYSQGPSSHSSTCDAMQGTCTTRGCQRRLNSDPLVGWHPAGERFCCADCINTAGARHSATCDEVSQSRSTSSATVERILFRV